MDRLRWWLVLGIMILNIMATQGQTKKVWVEYDTISTKSGVKLTTKVCMTPEKFAYYYTVDKNLGVIRDSIPTLVQGIERERKKREEEVKNLEETIQLTNRQKDLMKQNLDDCIGTNVQLELENTNLREKVSDHKTNLGLFGTAGVILGILISIAL